MRTLLDQRFHDVNLPRGTLRKREFASIGGLWLVDFESFFCFFFPSRSVGCRRNYDWRQPKFNRWSGFELQSSRVIEKRSKKNQIDCAVFVNSSTNLAAVTTVFVDTRLWKTKHSRKLFRNFRQSYVLSTCRIEIHQSQPASMTLWRIKSHARGCDWWISIRSVNNTQDWRKFWKRFRECFVFQSRVSTKTVVIYQLKTAHKSITFAHNRRLTTPGLNGIQIRLTELYKLRPTEALTYSGYRHSAINSKRHLKGGYLKNLRAPAVSIERELE